ncbi:hypothetical protein WA026_012117 [Henosepilachna vigintioctopunctata]|uniref:WD repeat protein mio zinc-ribbon like domain-containing protein n=1 Tax=Henosepilachna vigintioctopunctata TaxID=420089 RepID=A0AAW1V509_9CUCU
MNSKLEIVWTPHPDKFITWGSDICLYEVHPLKNNINTNIKLCNTNGANLISSNSNHPFIKCLDVHPKVDSDLLMAIGNLYGKVSLLSCGPSSGFDPQALTGKDLVPRHSRPCNAVLWNPVDNNVLAGCLDKYRSDHAVLLWDIIKFPPVNENNAAKLSMNTVQPAVELARPVAEYGISESAHSLGWFKSNSKQMVVGMNNKNIKLLDFRDPNKVVISNMTKAVYGVCVDPHNDKHLASYLENQTFIWDIRNFEKPIITLTHLKPVVKIEWCPTKYNLLGTLQKDSSCIILYDIQRTLVGNEEIEPSVLERSVLPGSPHNITSFSWHRSDESRFLTIALSGSIIDYTVFDRITLNWGATSSVVWTYGCKTMKYIQDNILNDISYKIKKRAKLEYGLKDEFWKNSDIADDDMLSNVWNWLYLSEQLVENNIFGDKDIVKNMYYKHPGVQSILKIDANTNKSELVTFNWADLGNPNCSGSVRIFKHEDRQRAMHLCSWDFESFTDEILEFVEHLEKDHAYTRAAAIAVFNLKVKLAIEILGKAPDHASDGHSLQIVAMALAGFCDDKNSTWKQFCSVLRTKLTDPYLKAMFSFLTADNYNYDNVLNENGMAVDDRVAFACLFLPDNKLHIYLKKLSDRLLEEGNLDGLLLTGTNADGIKLLQRYLDVTGDIQSTALLAVQAFSEEVSSHAAKHWVESYRNLLDTWQLWNERAKFDIMISSHRPNEKHSQQVYVSCNFCGKSISACIQGLNRPRGQFIRMGNAANNKLKVSSCPNCRKPLPRCAICLMHMGSKTESLNSDIENNKVLEFAHWFTWCQTCRHGGHASHMVHWFKEHSECPVTSCTCRCISIDSITSTMFTS